MTAFSATRRAHVTGCSFRRQGNTASELRALPYCFLSYLYEGGSRHSPLELQDQSCMFRMQISKSDHY